MDDSRRKSRKISDDREGESGIATYLVNQRGSREFLRDRSDEETNKDTKRSKLGV